MRIRLLACIAFSLAASLVFADDISFDTIFVAPATDMSKYYLGAIFGSVSDVLVGGSNVVVGKMFYVFNTGIITFTALLIFYTMSMSVVNTAQDGNAMGQKVSTWIVLRIVAGMSMLIPTYSGYSAIQVLVMWSVVQGVGFADNIWAQALDTIEAYGGSVVVPVSQGLETPSSTGASSSTNSSQYSDMNMVATKNSPTYSPTLSDTSGTATVASIFQSSACVEYLYNKCLDDNKSNSSACLRSNYGYFNTAKTNYDASANPQTSASSTWCFGKLATSGTVSTCDASCGKYISNTTSCEQGCSYYAEAFNNMVLAVAPMAADFYTSAVTTCNSDSSKCSGTSGTAQTLVDYNAANYGCATGAYNDQYVCSPSQMLISGASSYYQISMADRMQPDSLSNSDSSWYDSARSAGWAMAGSYYRNLVGGGGPSKQLKLQVIGLPKVIGAVTTKTPDTQSNNNENVYAALVGTKQAVGTDPSSPQLSPIGWFSNAAYYYLREMQGMLYAGSHESAPGGSLTTSPQTAAYDEFTALMLKHLIQTGDSFKTLGGGYSHYFPYTAAGDFTKYPGYVWNQLSSNIAVLVGLEIYSAGTDLYPPGIYTAPTTNYACGSAATKVTDTTFLGLISTTEIKAAKNVLGCSTPPYTGCFLTAVNSNCITSADSSPAFSGILGQANAAASSYLSDPLLSIANTGQYFMQNSMTYWTRVISQTFSDATDLAIDYMAVMTATSLVASVGAFLSSLWMPFDTGGGWAILSGALNGIAQFCFQLDRAMMEAWLPFGSALAMMFFMLGVMMGVYLPFVPFLLYLFGVISWLIAVVEAMVAAPLVAMGVTHPEGHDLLGKSEQALMLLLGVFIRPAAMVVGLIMAITLNYIMIGFLNYGFVVTLNPILAGFTSGDTQSFQLVIIVGSLIVYVYTIIEVINLCFSMIFQIPDKLLRWIGGPVEQSAGAQAMAQIKGGVSQSASGAAGGASSKASSAPSVQGQAPSASTSFKGSSSGGGESSGGGDK
ncbi:MAG: DotA/TraY family protein [Legionellales bacterium]|jgi:hypothetical protein|nr:DotA/TraY family protein [Legionellales bacterium]